MKNKSKRTFSQYKKENKAGVTIIGDESEEV